MRASEGRPGKLTLLGRRRKDEYGGYALGPQEEDRLDWEVRSKGRSYWAICAWDMLGISAALHSDADVYVEYAEDSSPARLSVEDGRLLGEVGGFVHFPLPLRRWYEDLVFT
jgi:hypothetical protein